MYLYTVDHFHFQQLLSVVEINWLVMKVELWLIQEEKGYDTQQRKIGHVTNIESISFNRVLHCLKACYVSSQLD